MSDKLRNRISRHIRDYDGQGWHRTGTETDLASARWLAEQVEDCGLEPHLEPFELNRISPLRSHLETDGRRIEGVPLFDGSFTGAEGTEGRLGLLGADGEIGLVEVSSMSAENPLDEARRSGPQRALVAITSGRGGQPGLAPRNAPSFTAPFGPPVLQVGSLQRDWLMERAERHAAACLVVEAERVPTEAFNVAAATPGRDSSLAPVVVMTPRSGWWHCAAERGGGIACWLEMMRALAESKPVREVRFVATSGHELGHLGLKSYLDRDPGLAKAALAWVHLGASIGAAEDPSPRLSASDEEMQSVAAEALARHVPDMPDVVPVGATPGGESRDIHERRGRYVSIAGGHATFHQEVDRWPDAVDAGWVARYARAFVDILARLSGATS